MVSETVAIMIIIIGYQASTSMKHLGLALRNKCRSKGLCLQVHRFLIKGVNYHMRGSG